jgi:hypothetical protein
VGISSNERQAGKLRETLIEQAKAYVENVFTARREEFENILKGVVVFHGLCGAAKRAACAISRNFR